MSQPAGPSHDGPTPLPVALKSLAARLDALEAEARSLAADLLEYHAQVRGGALLSKQEQRHFRQARGRLERLVSVYEAGSDLVELSSTE